jgi:hypothetical protein
MATHVIETLGGARSCAILMRLVAAKSDAMIRTDTPVFIVERQLCAVDRTGAKTRFSIRIGKPYAELDGERWACPVWLDGLDDRYPDIRGMDSLQAVTLALAFARSMMDGFAKRGLTFQYSTGETVSIDDLFRSEFSKRP